MINANLAIERSTTIISTDTLINVQDTCWLYPVTFSSIFPSRAAVDSR